MRHGDCCCSTVVVLRCQQARQRRDISSWCPCDTKLRTPRHEAPSEVSHNRGSGNRINQAWRIITAVSAKRTTVGSMLRNGRAAVNQTWINRQCVTSSFTSGVSRRVNVHQQRSRGLRVDRATFKVARINNAKTKTKRDRATPDDVLRLRSTRGGCGTVEPLRNCRATSGAAILDQRCDEPCQLRSDISNARVDARSNECVQIDTSDTISGIERADVTPRPQLRARPSGAGEVQFNIQKTKTDETGS